MLHPRKVTCNLRDAIDLATANWMKGREGAHSLENQGEGEN